MNTSDTREIKPIQFLETMLSSNVGKGKIPIVTADGAQKLADKINELVAGYNELALALPSAASHLSHTGSAAKESNPKEG